MENEKEIEYVTEKENVAHECYRCARFKRLYLKGDKRYNRSKWGFCVTHGKCVGVHECCDLFELMKKAKNRVYNSSLYYLHGLLNEISELRKVIEDGQYGMEDEFEEEQDGTLTE